MEMGLKVTPQQLQALSSRVSGSAAHIEGELGGLRSSLAPLGSDWAGAAQVQFSALWEEWQAGAAKVHDALSGISALLGQAGSAYAEAERAIAGSFRGM